MFLDRVQARRVIVTGSGAYRLALDEVSVDLDRFDELVLGAERATRADRLRLLTAAVALSTGEVLEHARYDEWVQEERLVYTDRTTRAHLDLSRDWLAEGELAPALRHAELALGLARYSEEAFRLIMLANHGLGHHDIVRRTSRSLPSHARQRPGSRPRPGDRGGGNLHRGTHPRGRDPRHLLLPGNHSHPRRAGTVGGLTPLVGRVAWCRSPWMLEGHGDPGRVRARAVPAHRRQIGCPPRSSPDPRPCPGTPRHQHPVRPACAWHRCSWSARALEPLGGRG